MRAFGIILILLVVALFIVMDCMGQTKKTNMAFKFYGTPATASAVVQRGTGTITSTDDSVMVDVATAFDTTKTWVVVQARTDSSKMEDMLYTVDIVDTNTFIVKRGDDTGGNFEFTYSVISDPGLTVSRYRGTILDAQDTLAVAISSVTTARTWVYPSYRMDRDIVWDIAYSVSHELESATSIKLRRISAKEDIAYVLQVVSYDSCTVQRGSVSNVGTAVTKDIAVSAVDSAKAFPMISLHSIAAGGSAMNDWAWYATWHNTVGSVDTMRLVRFDNYSYFKVFYEIVQFTDGSVVKPVHFTTTADQVDVTTAAVDTAYASLLGSGPQSRYAALDNGTSNRTYGMWTYRFNGATTSVRMQRYGSSAITSKGKAYVIQWGGYE